MTKILLYELYKDVFTHSPFEDCFKGENAFFCNFHFNHLKIAYLKYNFNLIFYLIFVNMGTPFNPPLYRVISYCVFIHLKKRSSTGRHFIHSGDILHILKTFCTFQRFPRYFAHFRGICIIFERHL